MLDAGVSQDVSVLCGGQKQPVESSNTDANTDADADAGDSCPTPITTEAQCRARAEQLGYATDGFFGPREHYISN